MFDLFPEKTFNIYTLKMCQNEAFFTTIHHKNDAVSNTVVFSE